MAERLRGSDYRFIAICLALLAASTWFSVRYFYLAFPEASIDFRVGRAEAQTLAERFLAGLHYDFRDYRTASSFTFDDDAKTFLEREAGVRSANQIMGSQVRLWRWSFRWFRPQQKEEFRVDITPRGEMAGFEHLIPEQEARAALTDSEARAAAEQFLRDTLRRDPATLDFVEVSTIDRPSRVDRTFTWKERDFHFHDATYRLAVTLLGQEVGGYREYLKIPEQWTRDFERLRARNEAAQFADTVVLLALAAAMVVVIVLRLRRHDIRWRRAAWVGVVGMALSLCASANQFPLQEFRFPTTDSYASFLAQQTLQAILTALGSGGLLFLITAAAEPLYREFLPSQISLGNLFRPQGVRTKAFLLGSILGLSLCGIFVAYQTAFYMVAYRFGAWSPADVPYSDLLNTRFPWAFVLFGGFLPAVSEEFMFRMFAIPFLRKLVRFLPAAVVLAGFTWGFGHAGYPQQPFYIRGVEVGIGGVALGLIMLRWGILPTLVWHYSVDAMYSAMLLLRSPSPYLRFSGAASAGIMVLPVALALIAYWRRGSFEPAMGLTNAQETTAVEQPLEVEREAEPGPISYHGLGVRVRVLGVAVSIAGLLAMLVAVSRFGSSPNYRIGMAEARADADQFLRAQGLDPSSFREVTYPAVHWGGDDSLAGKYFLERVPTPAASALFEQNRPIRYWAARYFRSLDQEEILVSVHPESGSVLGFAHAVPEDRPGAELPDDAARQIAAQFARSRGIDVDGMELKESSSEKKKARRDYTLIWEARPGDHRNVDDARFRVEIQVYGDRVAAWRSYWKIPEAFARRRSGQNALSIALVALRLGMLAAVAVYGILLLIRKIREGTVPWRGVIRWAVPAALLTAIGPLLSLSQLLKDYNTAIPLATFQAIGYTTIGTSVLAGFLVLAAAVAFVTSHYPESRAALLIANRRTLGLDASVVLLAAVGFALLLSQTEGWLMGRFHRVALYSIGIPSVVASSAPAVAAVAEAVRTTLLSAAALALAALLVKRAPRRWMLVLVALAWLTVPVPSAVRTMGEFVLAYGIELLWAGGALLFCVVFARSNYLAYALVLWIAALRPAMVALWKTGNPALEVHALALAAVMAASWFWASAPAWASRSASHVGPPFPYSGRR